MKSLFKKFVIVALRFEARLILKKYKPRVIAVTGSVGKTSTKDAIFAVLSKSVRVRASDKSFNSELGLPLTILGRPNAWNNPIGWMRNLFDGLLLIALPAQYPQWLVLEAGADKPGDISSLASWLRTDVAVITRLPEVPVHVEFFDSPEAVVREKASLINTLKAHGSLVIYADDERMRALADKAEARGIHTIRFGASSEAQVRMEEPQLLVQKGSWPTGMQAKLHLGDRTEEVLVKGVLGAHALMPLVAAAAVGLAVGRSATDILTGLDLYQPPKGRMRLIAGLKGSLIIDDTYNSSPAAVSAALDTLKSMKHGRSKMRRIAVLGDMLELGRLSVEEHRKIGAQVAKCADSLVTVGFRARDIAESALSNGMADQNILQYEDSLKVGQELQNLIDEHDVVLVKGSQSMRMERIVEDCMLEPEKAKDLLVRQDAQWKRK